MHILPFLSMIVCGIEIIVNKWLNKENNNHNDNDILFSIISETPWNSVVEYKVSCAHLPNIQPPERQCDIYCDKCFLVIRVNYANVITVQFVFFTAALILDYDMMDQVFASYAAIFYIFREYRFLVEVVWVQK